MSRFSGIENTAIQENGIDLGSKRNDCQSEYGTDRLLVNDRHGWFETLVKPDLVRKGR